MKKNRFIILLFILLLAVLYIFSSPIYKSVDITSAVRLAHEALMPNQEIIQFESKNPFNFYDIFNRIDKMSSQKVYGVLTKPDRPGKYPLIMGVAGSKGWGDHHHGYMQRYLDMGFAVFTLHSFKSRDVESTVGEQLSVTTAMMIYDAFKALETLSNDSQIDADRTGIIGWSLGGGVALFTAWQPIQKAISPNHKFSAHIPIYPPCMAKPDILNFNNVPIHILIGEKDNWVPAAACEELVQDLNASGHGIDITVYSNAHHSFDRDQDEIFIEDAYSFTDCRLRIAENGVVKTIKMGFPLSSPTLQKIGLAFCANRGTIYGGNEKALNHARDFAMSFMKQHLSAR